MQIFRTLSGPAILVRHEDRGEGLEYCFVLVRDRLTIHRWEKEMPPEFELVYDPGARAEADLALAETNALVKEKGVLLECLTAALAMLDDRAAEEVRAIWRAKMKDADLVSSTK